MLRKLVAALALCVSVLGVQSLVTRADAHVYQPTNHSVTACGKHDYVLTYLHPNWHWYGVRNTFWLGTGPTCVTTPADGHPGFTVTKTPAPTNPNGWGRVTTYPSIFRGCIWDVCTPDTNIPIRADHIRNLSSGWTTTERAGGIWNASYDLWFGKHRQTQGHADGAELMIWLNEHGGCCALRANSPIIKIDGYKFFVQSWRPHDSNPAFGPHGVSWNYIQFRLVHPRWKIKLDLHPFITYAEHHRWVLRDWWLENVNAGFEIWNGGVGLSTHNFWLHLNDQSLPKPPVKHRPKPPVKHRPKPPVRRRHHTHRACVIKRNHVVTCKRSP